jgi:hypothetical protein
MDRTIDLSLLGEVKQIPTDAAIESASKALGIRIPSSYSAFVRRYGFGISLNNFIIYVPTEPGETRKSENLVASARTLGRENREVVAGKLASLEPDGSEELLLRLVPFAYSENGEQLAWDPAKATGTDEYEIYLIDSRYAGVFRAGPDLTSVLERAASPRMGGLIPGATKALPRTFRPASMFVSA